MWQPLMGLKTSDLAVSGLFANIFIDSNGVAHAYARLVSTSNGRIITPHLPQSAGLPPKSTSFSV